MIKYKFQENISKLENMNEQPVASYELAKKVDR
jgi:hypothetical protein